MTIDGVYIYPNPSDGNFIINFPDDHLYKSLEIVNPDGKIIHQRTIDNKTRSVTINSAVNLLKGVYFIRFRGEDSYVVKKVVIS